MSSETDKKISEIEEQIEYHRKKARMWNRIYNISMIVWIIFLVVLFTLSLISIMSG